MNPVNLDNEFVSLLTNKQQPDVRRLTIQCVLDMTILNANGINGIRGIAQNQQCLEALISCLDDEQPAIRKVAYKTMINLSAVDSATWKIIGLEGSKDFVLNTVKVVLETENDDADLASKFLANLARVEKAATRVFDVINSNKDAIGFDKIINAFCTKGYNTKANLDYLGSFLANLTQVKETRKFVLDRERCIVQRLLPFMQYMDSKVRRQGVITIIKNCCFELDYHDWLLSEKVDMLPYLLLPLAGPEEFDDDDNDRLPLDLQYLPPEKKREPDSELRQMLVEAVYKMCATKAGRGYIKEKNTYVIMRELDQWETASNMKQPIEDLIQLLIGDEPSDDLGGNLQEIVIPEDVRQKFEDSDLKEKQDQENRMITDS